MACAELELDGGCCFYPTKGGLHLPERSPEAWRGTPNATTLLDEADAFLRAAERRARSWSETAATTLLDDAYASLRTAKVACVVLEQDGCCCEYNPTGRGLSSFAPPDAVREAGAGRLLLLPYWTRSTPPFAPSGGVR